MKIYDYNGRKNICGDRIRQARVQKKISQTDLAAQMQIYGITIDRNSISRMESGTRFIPDYELPVYANILEVSLEWLLGISEQK